jgi:hypothetical protein
VRVGLCPPAPRPVYVALMPPAPRCFPRVNHPTFRFWFLEKPTHTHAPLATPGSEYCVVHSYAAICMERLLSLKDPATRANRFTSADLGPHLQVCVCGGGGSSFQFPLRKLNCAVEGGEKPGGGR